MKNTELLIKGYVPYEVDFEYLEEKVQFFLEDTDNKSIKKNFSEIINFFSEKKIIQPVCGGVLERFRVDCGAVKYTIRCENLIARQILAVILNLQNEKKPIWCKWYLYDYDSCNEMPQFEHSFFLVNGGAIQSDSICISTSCDECDQCILIESSVITVPNSSMPFWSNTEKNQKATTLWCYQKFYQETEKGQILAIRQNLDSGESKKIKAFKLADENACPLSYTSTNQVLLSAINRKIKWVVVILVVILYFGR